MDSLGHNVEEERTLLEISIADKTETSSVDSLNRSVNSIMSDRTIAVDDSLMRSLDEDPNDTISVIVTTPDTLEVNMYPKGAKGYSPRVDMNKVGGKTTLTIYDENGSHTAEILDGSGTGLDVQVNGTSVVDGNVADIRLKTINNQSIVGTGNIEIQGGEGTKNYDTLQNKPKINNTTLQGNLSSDDLGLQSKITANNKLDFSLVDNVPSIPSKTSDLTNDNGFITKSVNNLDNYYNKNYINNISANVETNTQAIAALDEEKANVDDLATVATTGKYGDLLNKPNIPNVVDNVTSIDTANALSAYQGKLLNDRINNVESRGRFLAIWNAATGKPLTDPAELPYTYRTGDWYRVGTTAAVNYMPDGSQYDGTASRVPYTDPIATGDCFWYDGTTWKLEVNHAVEGGVQDVLINGTSVVSDNSANILVDGTYSSSNKIATQSSIPTRVGQLINDEGYITNSYHDATKVDKETGKGLSTNDYTTAEKEKLADLENYDDTEIKGLINEKYTKPNTGIPKSDLIGSVQLSLNKADTALQSFTEEDPIFTASPAASITTLDIETWDAKSSFSGDYNDLRNKPTIPSKTSDLTNDSGYIDSSYHDATKQNIISNSNKLSSDLIDDVNKTNKFVTSAEKITWNNKANISDIPTNVSQLNNDAEYITSSYHDNTKQDKLVSGTNIKTINGQSVLGSGDLAGGLIDDVKVNTVSVVTNRIANIDLSDYAKEEDIPTKTSDLTNDSGFITASYHDDTKQNTLISGTNIKTINNQSLLGSGDITIDMKVDNVTTRLNSDNKIETIGIYTTQNNGRKIWEGTKSQYDAILNKDENVYYYITDDQISYNELTDKPTIPTKTSELINNSDFITSSYHDNSKQDTLISGTTIKTINNESILGSGNIQARIEAASSTELGGVKVRLDGSTLYIRNDGSDA